MVIDLTQEMVALNVITQPLGVAIELNTIIKICKYKRLHKGHHFIPMAVEMQGTHGCDMDRFIKGCAHLFHYR